MILFKPCGNCFGSVILSLNKLAAAGVAHALCFGLFIKNVIGIAALGADTSAGKSGRNFFIRHLDIKHLIDLHAHILKRLRLRNGARKSVKDKSVYTVFFF